MARRPSATNKMSAGATVEGLNAALRAFGRLDKDAKDAARDEVQKISRLLANEIKAVGSRRQDPRDRHVAESIRAKRDRLPLVLIGKADQYQPSGNRRRTSFPRASDLMYGMEFGSAVDRPTRRGGRPGWRFPERTPRRGAGNEGYWIFPTARQQQPRVVDLWAKALEDVARDWSR